VKFTEACIEKIISYSPSITKNVFFDCFGDSTFYKNAAIRKKEAGRPSAAYQGTPSR